MTFVVATNIALWAKLGGQVVLILKTRTKEIHFISLFSKFLENKY